MPMMMQHPPARRTRPSLIEAILVAHMHPATQVPVAQVSQVIMNQFGPWEPPDSEDYHVSRRRRNHHWHFFWKFVAERYFGDPSDSQKLVEVVQDLFNHGAVDVVFTTHGILNAYMFYKPNRLCTNRLYAFGLMLQSRGLMAFDLLILKDLLISKGHLRFKDFLMFNNHLWFKNLMIFKGLLISKDLLISKELLISKDDLISKDLLISKDRLRLKDLMFNNHLWVKNLMIFKELLIFRDLPRLKDLQLTNLHIRFPVDGYVTFMDVKPLPI
ncbi:hypothetical protein F4778DRAFT_780293 [Xylariomycetidae sp. FL2044]|nr:hypothetical protein F4778DRAFT_780293 [Xylariomycetidae sp. FL2044]